MIISRNLLLLLLILCTTNVLISQKYWTGTTSTNWNTASNWSPSGVPSFAEVVVIPNVTNDPIIKTAGIVVSTITVQSGGVLNISTGGTIAMKTITVEGGGAVNITSGGTLNIGDSPYPGITNQGTLTSNGTINIGLTAGVGNFGLENTGIFSNNIGGQLNIDRCLQVPLFNNGGTFNNAGTITMGALATAGNWCIHNIGTFNNNTGGIINANRAIQFGIKNENNGIFNNAATINIGTFSVLPLAGLFNTSTFINTMGGQINIDRCSFAGIWNEAGTFTNAATITLGSQAVVGQKCIYNKSTFRNNAGGVINANNSTQYGIENNSEGTFENSATINIGSTSSVGTHGLVQRGVFSNNTGGHIKIDRSSEIALYSANGSFTNAATITIGSLAGVGAKCILNWITFNNNAGGVINANNSTQYGIENVFGGTINNSATIHIGSTSEVGSYGLFTEGNINNNIGGQININRCSSGGMRNNDGVYAPATISNAGSINIGSIAAVGTYGIYNQGPFNNSMGGQIFIDRNTATGIVNSWNTFSNTSIITIGSNSASSMLQGIENFGITGAFNNNMGGQIKIDRCSSKGISNVQGIFTNAATITMGSIATIGESGISNSTSFNNNTGGQINIDRATISGIVNTDGTFTNSAVIKIGQITPITDLITSTNGNFINNVGGNLQGTGSIAAAFFTNQGGTLSPGYSSGIQTLTSSENFSNSSMFLEVNGLTTAGVNFDQIIVSGTATLGGTLNLSINFTPDGGDYVAILTAGQVTGTFSTVTGLTAAWDIVYSANEVGLQAKDVTTWTGSVNTNWFNASNWTLRVPTVKMDAIIPNVNNDPVIASSGALARTVVVNSGGVFTIVASGTLTINTLGNQGSQGILNNGTLSNNGIMNIGPTQSVGQYGILNNGNFNNNTGAQINIDRTTSFGIWNDAGTFTNAATLNIGASATIGTRCIYNENSFSNNVGGVINANNASLYGIEHANGTFTNVASINIGSISAVGTYGLRSSATFNNTGGVIKVDRCSSFGLRNNAGTFTNSATLTIGSVAAVGTTGISNAANINNNTGGIINIDRSSIRGIINVTGTITNAATINIGTNAATAVQFGIENDATFNNTGSGQININRCSVIGVWNSSGTFTNSATLNIGSTNSVGLKCIYNENLFTNGSGGTINANNATQYGIENFTGTFTNAATINIGTSSAVGTDGLRNAAIFHNNTGGQIHLDRSTNSGLLSADGTFTNAATITIGNNIASAMSSGIENEAAFNNTGNGQVNIIRAASAGIWNNGGSFANSGTLNIGSTAAIGQRCIYSNASGTFNNNTGGTINANNASLYGIEVISGTFTNLATINIGNISNVGSYGLRNSGIFNNSGGQIKIDRSISFALRNNAGTFNNSAILTIGSIAAIGTTGISNAASIINNESGVINIDRASIRGITNVTGSFSNGGTLSIGALPASSMQFGIENTASFQNTASGVIDTDRSATAGIRASASLFTNQGSITLKATVGP